MSQESEPLVLKNIGIKLLQSTVGVVELPHESKPTHCCPHVLVCLPGTAASADGGEVSPADRNRKF